MKKLLTIFMLLAMAMTFISCGNANQSDAVNTVTENETLEKTVEINAETVAAGNTITTPFAEMTISEAGIANNIKTKIKSGNTTYISGPDEKSDSEFVYIRGTMKNTSKEEIGMVNIEGFVEVDGYTYKLEHVNIIESDGSHAFGIAPLKTYSYTIAAEVPNELIQSASPCTVNFGFNENFASAISFDDNVTYDYNYTMTIAK